MMSLEEPPVYIATYSSTDVYECQINNSPIMRRCKDNWVNATQILKCCNFPKAKRTKILEKGVQQGLHEKIQGGYGRFQGTWIPLEDAQRLAANYGVTPDMAPVLYLDINDPNFYVPKKVKQMNKDGTPVKRKYTKKAKKNEDTPSKKMRPDMANSLAAQNSFNSQSSMADLSFSQMSSQMSQSMPDQISQVPFQVPAHQLPPTFGHSDVMANASMPAYTSHQQAVQNEFQNYQMQMQRYQQQQVHPQDPQKYFPGGQPHPGSFPTDLHPQSQVFDHLHHKMFSSTSTNEGTWSQEDIHQQRESDTSMSSNEETTKALIGSKQGLSHSSKMGHGDQTYCAQLLRFFSEERSEIPYFLHNIPFDFNINEPIDDEGHTPLHWAASIGNHTMVSLLLTKGASPLVVNNFGLNPLSKLISFNNCYELKNFPKVLDELELCLINTDINGRTPLHYLSQFAKVKTKYESLRYYLHVILNKLTSLSNQNPSKQVNLLKNVLDHQDLNGDTCLHLAAKAGSGKIVKELMDYGARDDLENIHKETAKVIIAQYNLLGGQVEQAHQSQSGHQTYDKPDTTTQASSHQSQVMTPIQPMFSGQGINTPDTQKTTVQDDDEDVSMSFADKESYAGTSKEDNKENVFMEELKGYDSMSTPMHKNQSNAPIMSGMHQPLAVISEKPHDSSGKKTEDRKLAPSFPQTHQPQPPKLDSEGRILESVKKESENKAGILQMNDLSSMVSVMINALSGSYRDKISELNSEQERLRLEVEKKSTLNDLSFSRFKALLQDNGISDFDTFQKGYQLLTEKTAHREQEVYDLVGELRQAVSMALSRKLEPLLQVDHEEENPSDKENDEDEDDQADRFELARSLTDLQLKKSDLTSQILEGIKNYGVNSKMLKYRKLISLSCNLSVEDIDSLIDGIEESLMEATMVQ